MSNLDRVLGAAGRSPRHASPAYRDQADEAELVLAAAGSVREALSLLGGTEDPSLRTSLSAAQGILDHLAGDTRLSALDPWTERTAHDPLTLALAKGDDGDDDTSQGKDEDYADPGWQSDGKKRYPVTEGGQPSEKRIRAGWSYINQKDNADKYGDDDKVKKIKAKIKSAGRAIGIEFADDASGKAA